MKVLAIVLVAFVANALSASLSDDRTQFEAFKAKFEKNYESQAEENRRFAIFVQNLRENERHNKMGSSWKKGVTQFSDLTHEEFVSKHLNGYVKMPKTQTPAPKKKIDLKALPATVDWSVNATTPIKDQKSCGSCWAFTTVEIIESYAMINTGKMPILSPQQITSCVGNGYECGGQGGCTGSIVELGLTYAQLFAVTTDDLYPYASGNGVTGECDYDPSVHTPAAQVMGYELLPRNDYETIMNHLANVGPLAVAVDATNWYQYEAGVYDGCDYGKNIAINHAVQLVGYGVDTSEGIEKPYWKVRNSWGATYGEQGYIRLARDTTGEQCGSDNTPLVGVGCKNDGNDVQTVCGQCGILFDAVYPINTFVPDPK